VLPEAPEVDGVGLGNRTEELDGADDIEDADWVAVGWRG